MDLPFPLLSSLPEEREGGLEHEAHQRRSHVPLGSVHAVQWLHTASKSRSSHEPFYHHLPHTASRHVPLGSVFSDDSQQPDGEDAVKAEQRPHEYRTCYDEPSHHASRLSFLHARLPVPHTRMRTASTGTGSGVRRSVSAKSARASNYQSLHAAKTLVLWSNCVVNHITRMRTAFTGSGRSFSARKQLGRRFVQVS